MILTTFTHGREKYPVNIMNIRSDHDTLTFEVIAKSPDMELMYKLFDIQGNFIIDESLLGSVTSMVISQHTTFVEVSVCKWSSMEMQNDSIH